MGLYKDRQFLISQIAQVSEIYEDVKDNFFMEKNWSGKLAELKEELSLMPEVLKEPKVQLLFSGLAVVGSEGIKSSFLSKIINPFQELIKEQEAIIEHSRQDLPEGAKRRDKTNTNLYLTNLARGSFGVELTHLEHDDLFHQANVAESISETIEVIKKIASNEIAIEDVIGNNSNSYIENLKKFLDPIKKHKSIVKIESGTSYVELTKDDIVLVHEKIGSIVQTSTPVVVSGVFKGFLLHSNKFELINEEGKAVQGKVSKDINEDREVALLEEFANKECSIHLNKHVKSYASGRETIQYELVNITWQPFES